MLRGFSLLYFKNNFLQKYGHKKSTSLGGNVHLSLNLNITNVGNIFENSKEKSKKCLNSKRKLIKYLNMRYIILVVIFYMSLSAYSQNGKETNRIEPDKEEVTELIKRMKNTDINNAETLLEVLEATLLEFLRAKDFITLIENSPYLGFPIIEESKCESKNYGYKIIYESTLVDIIFSFLEKNNSVGAVSISFRDDRLYDRTMIDVHKKYEYKNGRYEYIGVKCELSKIENINILYFSRL